MKLKHDRGDHIMEYDLKVGAVRVSFFILFILLTLYTYNIIKTDSDSSSRIDSIFNSSFDYKTLVIEENSRGQFYSLKDDVQVSGSISKISENGNDYVRLGRDFSITNNRNLQIILSINPVGKARILVSDLLGNIGEQKYQLPENIDYNYHEYIIIWNSKTNEAHAYAKIEE